MVVVISPLYSTLISEPFYSVMQGGEEVSRFMSNCSVLPRLLEEVP